MKPNVKHTLFILACFLVSFLANSATLVSKGQLSSGEVFRLNSKVLAEDRDIYVALPENYQHSKHSYPIVVVFDAEYLFDLTSSIAKLSSSRNFMPESIIVGIPNNTGKRIDMAMEIFNEKGEPFFYGDNIGQSDRYLKFLKNELFPELSKNYRVNNHRTIIGMSPSFGPVLQAFWSQPDLFSGYIVLAAEIGQHLKSGETIANKLVKTIAKMGDKSKALYVGTSSKDIEKRGPKEANLYNDIPKQIDAIAPTNFNVKFEIVPNEDHYSMAILGIKNGFETIYPREKFNISYREFLKQPDPVKALKKTYQTLSNEYGYDIVPIEASFYNVNSLTKIAEILARQKKTTELLSWLNLALEYYPNSPNLNEMLKQAQKS